MKSSIPIGYLLEEYIVSKLENYFAASKRSSLIMIQNQNSTAHASYDFSILFENEIFLVNLKANKSNNNAIAAINKIYDDYVLNNTNKSLHFLILKINYSIGKSEFDKPSKSIN
ncbi:UpaP162 family type II restriction enzyme, partial [Metamycoplasma hyosynoviae]|uniref:UpaP162 family type II restriction enzyme n=1 Tax=Metamycoplasma hyosynoviae TaxID=29559 RepID=UPI003B641AB8